MKSDKVTRGEIRGPAARDGYTTPDFGIKEVARLGAFLGSVGVLWTPDMGEYPHFPVAV